MGVDSLRSGNAGLSGNQVVEDLAEDGAPVVVAVAVARPDYDQIVFRAT